MTNKKITRNLTIKTPTGDFAIRLNSDLLLRDGFIDNQDHGLVRPFSWTNLAVTSTADKNDFTPHLIRNHRITCAQETIDQIIFLERNNLLDNLGLPRHLQVPQITNTIVYGAWATELAMKALLSDDQIDRCRIHDLPAIWQHVDDDIKALVQEQYWTLAKESLHMYTPKLEDMLNAHQHIYKDGRYGLPVGEHFLQYEIIIFATACIDICAQTFFQCKEDTNRNNVICRHIRSLSLLWLVYPSATSASSTQQETP